MKVIRKIWIGKAIKDDSMSWELNQQVAISKDRRAQGTIINIEKDKDNPEKFHIYVKKKSDDVVMRWKTTTMKYTVEYDLTL